MTITRISVFTISTAICLATSAKAELLPLADCDGTSGIGVMAYSVTKGMMVEATTELTEVCWNPETATFTGQETSRDLQLTQNQGGLKMYQRLNGGAVSPLNEQFQVGPWEGHGGGTMPHFRWTTESSRSPDEINGADFVTTEGFLLTEAGYTPKPDAAEYPLDMVLTAQAGSLGGMVYNLFLPMQATLSLDGDTFAFSTQDQVVANTGDVTIGWLRGGLDREGARLHGASGRGVRLVEGPEDVLGDPDIDIVDICLPPHLHRCPSPSPTWLPTSRLRYFRPRWRSCW